MRLLFLAGAPLLLAGLAVLAGSCAGGDSASDFSEFERTLLPVGAAAPDVTVTGMDGQPLALSSLRGKTLLVNFWFYH